MATKSMRPNLGRIPGVEGRQRNGKKEAAPENTTAEKSQR